MFGNVVRRLSPIVKSIFKASIARFPWRFVSQGLIISKVETCFKSIFFVAISAVFDGYTWRWITWRSAGIHLIGKSTDIRGCLLRRRPWSMGVERRGFEASLTSWASSVLSRSAILEEKEIRKTSCLAGTPARKQWGSIHTGSQGRDLPVPQCHLCWG